MSTPSPNSEPKAEFWRLFDQHWNAGTGRPASLRRASSSWYVKDFADALATAGAATDEDTINKWLRHANLPRRLNCEAILAAFFAATPDHPGAAAMRHAWTKAGAPAPRPRRRPAIPPPGTPSADSPGGDWEIAGSYQLDPGLIAFRIAKPTDNTGNAATLVGIFRFGHAESISRGKSVFLGVTEATLTIASDHYTARPGSTLADRTHAHVRALGEEQVISGPKAGDVLHGDVLPGTGDGPGHLAIMERNAEREGPMTATVAAPASQFRAWEPGRASSAVKDAVIAALLNATLRKDRRGRVLLATTTLRRRR